VTELDLWGRIIMSPVNTEHAGLAGELSHLLRAQPGGRMLVEVGVRTGDGVLSPDVAWCSDAFWQARRDEAPLESAPEICVELASSSNTRQALQAKVAAHLAAGAVVSWIVFPRSRRVDFHGASGVTAASSYSVDVSKLFD
jgi:Uma2 family endonuclease